MKRPGQVVSLALHKGAARSSAGPDRLTCVEVQEAMTEFTPSAPSPTKASVYRYYDAQGVLLYVGFTQRGLARNLEHAIGKEWWPFVHRQEVDHFPTPEQALAAERRLIGAHRPPFNRQHNPDYAGMRSAYLQAVALGDEAHLLDELTLYAQLRHRIPLTQIQDSVDPRNLILMSDPAHWRLARTLVLPHPVPVRPTIGGGSVGGVQLAEACGHRMVLRGRLKTVIAVTQWKASLKITSCKAPVSAFIKSIEMGPA